MIRGIKGEQLLVIRCNEKNTQEKYDSSLDLIQETVGTEPEQV